MGIGVTRGLKNDLWILPIDKIPRGKTLYVLGQLRYVGPAEICWTSRDMLDQSRYVGPAEICWTSRDICWTGRDMLDRPRYMLD